MRRISQILLTCFTLLFLTMVQAQEVKTSHLRLTQVAGHELFSLKNCGSCHTLEAEAKGKLTPVPNKRDDDWFNAHVEKESPIVLDDAKSARKQKRVLKKEVEALTDFLFESSADARIQIIKLAETIRAGAYLGYQNNCTGCHKIAGDGKEIGPDLTFIADAKKDRAWHLSNLKNPQQFSDESPMPALADKLSDKQLNKIVDYLMTLKK